MSKPNNGKGLPYLKEWTCALAQDARVKSATKVVAGVLREHADTRNATVYLGFNTLGRLSGVSGDTAKKHRRKLRDHGWLTDTGRTQTIDGNVVTVWEMTIPEGVPYDPPSKVARGRRLTPHATDPGGSKRADEGSKTAHEGETSDPHTAKGYTRGYTTEGVSPVVDARVDGACEAGSTPMAPSHDPFHDPFGTSDDVPTGGGVYANCTTQWRRGRG